MSNIELDALRVVVEVLNTDELLALRREKFYHLFFFLCVHCPFTLKRETIDNHGQGFSLAVFDELFGFDSDDEDDETAGLVTARALLSRLASVCARSGLPIPKWNASQGADEYEQQASAMDARVRPEIRLMTHLGLIAVEGVPKIRGWVKEILTMPNTTPRSLYEQLFRPFLGWDDEIMKSMEDILRPLTLDSMLA